MRAQARAEGLAAEPERIVETGDTTVEESGHASEASSSGRAMTLHRLPVFDRNGRIPINGLTEHALKIHGAPPAFLEDLTTKELARAHRDQHPGGGGHFVAPLERIDRRGGKR
jgi:hypothetical protein